MVHSYGSKTVLYGYTVLCVSSAYSVHYLMLTFYGKTALNTEYRDDLENFHLYLHCMLPSLVNICFLVPPPPPENYSLIPLFTQFPRSPLFVLIPWPGRPLFTQVSWESHLHPNFLRVPLGKNSKM